MMMNFWFTRYNISTVSFSFLFFFLWEGERKRVLLWVMKINVSNENLCTCVYYTWVHQLRVLNLDIFIKYAKLLFTLPKICRNGYFKIVGNLLKYFLNFRAFELALINNIFLRTSVCFNNMFENFHACRLQWH